MAKGRTSSFVAGNQPPEEPDFEYGYIDPPVQAAVKAVAPEEITLDQFKVMIDIRAKALDLALKMPNSRLPSTIYKKAEEIEKWLTRK